MQTDILRLMNAGKINLSKNTKKNKNIALESLKLVKQLNEKNRL